MKYAYLYINKQMLEAIDKISISMFQFFIDLTHQQSDEIKRAYGSLQKLS